MNWCFWTVVLEKTFESPLDCKEIQPVHPKGNQSWIFIRRTDVEVETPMFWPADRTDSLEKTLILGKIEGRRRKGQQSMDGWMASPTRWTWVWANSGREAWCAVVHGVSKSQTNWETELNWLAGMKWLWNKDIHLVSESREISFLPLSHATSDNLRLFEIF